MRRSIDIHPDPTSVPGSTRRGLPRVPLLLVIGPPGVGKSAAARQIAGLLEEARIGFACVDRDEFGVDGLLHEDPLIDLDDILQSRVAAGAQLLVVAWRVESASELARVRAALAWTDMSVCRLHAGSERLLARIAAGQPSFQRLHLQTMALEIAPRLDTQVAADIVLSTDDTPPAGVARRAYRQWAMHGAPLAGNAAT